MCKQEAVFQLWVSCIDYIGLQLSLLFACIAVNEASKEYSPLWSPFEVLTTKVVNS